MPGTFHISLHAQEQMQNRGIDPEQVSQTLETPDQVVEEDALDVYQSVFFDGDQGYLLRVYVNSEKSLPVVVTVYKTSKIKKYLQ